MFSKFSFFALLLGLLAASTAQAQAPTWDLAITDALATTSHTNTGNNMVTDASGNVLVVGAFRGQVRFGSIVLTSRGGSDAYLAKYLPATRTWAWAIRAGGYDDDGALDVAVSGSSVYVVGTFTNNAANATGVLLDAGTAGPPQPQYGAASGTPTSDIVVAAYTDQGTGVALRWSQVAGGTDTDLGQGIAVSGSSVYITGSLWNDRLNTNQVVFGGAGTTAGTQPQYGAASSGLSNDLLVAKYTDNGATGTFRWSQVAGGSGYDLGNDVAVSGSSVYVTGTIRNSLSNASAVVFGGAGTVAGTLPQHGASAVVQQNIVLAKYVDQGSTAAVAWTQVAGGTAEDRGLALAVSGARVYLAGYITNTTTDYAQVRFGGAGTVPGAVAVTGTSYAYSRDMLLACYTDQGTSAALNWTQVAGGFGEDDATGLAVSGNRIYLSGSLTNNASNGYNVLFGGGGTTLGTVPVPGISTSLASDVLVAGYTDQGSSATLNWTRVAGGFGPDFGYRVALGGAHLYVLGGMEPTATFGSLVVSVPWGYAVYFLAALDLSATLATTGASTNPALSLYPNPAAGRAILGGAPAGAAVGIFDALGRRVATATADAKGAAALPGGLAPGLYLVRAGAGTARWVVE